MRCVCHLREDGLRDYCTHDFVRSYVFDRHPILMAVIKYTVSDLSREDGFAVSFVSVVRKLDQLEHVFDLGEEDVLGNLWK